MFISKPNFLSQGYPRKCELHRLENYATDKQTTQLSPNCKLLKPRQEPTMANQKLSTYLRQKLRLNRARDKRDRRATDLILVLAETIYAE